MIKKNEKFIQNYIWILPQLERACGTG